MKNVKHLERGVGRAILARLEERNVVDAKQKTEDALNYAVGYVRDRMEHLKQNESEIENLSRYKELAKRKGHKVPEWIVEHLTWKQAFRDLGEWSKTIQ